MTQCVGVARIAEQLEHMRIIVHVKPIRETLLHLLDKIYVVRVPIARAL